jgi:hypothetical protein
VAAPGRNWFDRRLDVARDTTPDGTPLAELPGEAGRDCSAAESLRTAPAHVWNAAV